MLPRLFVVLIAVAALVPAPASAQKKKDYDRAREYMEKDADYQEMLADDVYKHLTPQQQKELEDKIVRYIASRIKGKKKKQIQNVDVVWESGSTKKQLQGEKTDITAGNGKYQVVELKQDVREIPAKFSVENKPLDVPNFGNLFADNEWVPHAGKKTDMENALAATAALIKSKGGYVTRVLIRASASTLRNTEAAASLTYAQLSEKRAEEAKKLIEAAFAKEKVVDADGKTAVVDPEDVSVKAANGDGTSGPGSPYPCPKDMPGEFCSGGDDAPYDMACGFKSLAANGMTCKAPPPPPGADECAWTAEDDDNDGVDCAQWKIVRELRSKPRFIYANGGKDKKDNWTKEEVSRVKSFYAPFKYVEARICAAFKTTSVEEKPGEAHMVLALVETESNGTIKIKHKHKFKTKKPKKVKKKKPRDWKPLPCTMGQ